jgi:hypothetical protein
MSNILAIIRFIKNVLLKVANGGIIVKLSYKEKNLQLLGRINLVIFKVDSNLLNMLTK